ncbi:MAG: TlpA disulfide reductase family protein [Vicinamibacterales bacterium]
MEEVPLLKQLQSKYSATMTLVGIATDDDMGKIDRTVKEKRMTWPILADAKGSEGPILTAYHVQGTPDIFVLDARGRIFKRLNTATEIEATLQALPK